MNALRKWWVWPIIIVAVVGIVFTLLPGGSTTADRPLTEFVQDAKAGRVRSVEVHGSDIRYKLIGDEQTFSAVMEENDTIRAVLQDAGVAPQDFPPIEIKRTPSWGKIIDLAFSYLPAIIIVGIMIFFLRRAQQAQGVDPVCGKRTGSGDAAGSSTFANVAYRFCSLECKQMFDANPVRYLLKS